jgi:hypothetical protein
MGLILGEAGRVRKPSDATAKPEKQAQQIEKIMDSPLLFERRMAEAGGLEPPLPD